MSYLLRVQLPDVPGSLGRLASAVGDAGGNIHAIEIVSRSEGYAVDDVFLAADGEAMPDSFVSACQQLEGVTVLWVSRYAAGSNLFLDLEAVQSMTEDPRHAKNTVVDLLPQVFRVDWAMRVRRSGREVSVVHATGGAPAEFPEGVAWPVDEAVQAVLGQELLVVATPLGKAEAVLVGRRGGPDFLGSEVARLRHLVALAESIAR